MPNKDVRIATYLTTYNGKNTSITFYDNKEYLINASRTKLEIHENRLYFVPDKNGYSLNNSRIQISTKNIPRVQDGEYALEYDCERKLYYVDFDKKMHIDINEGARRGEKQNKTGTSSQFGRKTSDSKEVPAVEDNKNWVERYNDMIAQNNSATATKGHEEIIKAFLNAGLDTAIEEGNMDDIKAYHRILKKL